MSLAKHTKANREFFAKGCAPTKDEWRAWVLSGAVRGKVIEETVLIDLDWFATRDVMTAVHPSTSGVDLLK